MMKTKGRIFVLLAFLIVAGMIVSPVCAAELTGYMLEPLDTLKTEKVEFNDVYNLTYDAAANGNAIMLIHFKVAMEHQADFVVYTYQEQLAGSASTVWNVSIIPPTTTTSSLTFSGETKTYSYLDTNPEFDYFLSGYARDTATNESGIIVYNAGYGSFDNDLAIFHATGNIQSNLIYRFDVVSDAPFDVDITYAETNAVAAAAGKNWLEIAYDWMAFAVSLALLVKDFAIATLYWIKFIFVDNLLITVALYFGISMAYTASTSRNIFVFYRRFLRDQRAFFEFIIGLWRSLIEIIASFRGIFRL